MIIICALILLYCILLHIFVYTGSNFDSATLLASYNKGMIIAVQITFSNIGGNMGMLFCCDVDFARIIGVSPLMFGSHVQDYHD